MLAEAEEDQSEPLEAVNAIRLLLLTGCRREEVLGLKWEHVNFERGYIHFQDSKTGAKIVHLGSAVVHFLSSVPRLEDSPYVLPGRNGKGHFVGVHHPWTRLRAKARLEDVRIHDLRHSFASVGAGDGMGLPIIGKLLGHRNPATTARYSHLADNPLREAADQISGQLAASLNGTAAKAGDDVVADLIARAGSLDEDARRRLVEALGGGSS